MNPESKPRATIETAHRYVLEDLHNPELIRKEIEMAESVAKFLAAKGFENTKIILLDEMKPEANAEVSADSWRWRLFIERDKSKALKELPPDYKIWLESAYEAPALKLADEIKERIRENQNSDSDIRLAGEDENRIKIGSNKEGQNISLFQPFKTHTGEVVSMPSCPLLDVCVYQEKLKQAELAVTLLPASFKDQQAEVRSLFTILGQSPAVIVLYFDPETFAITDAESWNSEYARLAEELKQEGMRM